MFWFLCVLFQHFSSLSWSSIPLTRNLCWKMTPHLHFAWAIKQHNSKLKIPYILSICVWLDRMKMLFMFGDFLTSFLIHLLMFHVDVVVVVVAKHIWLFYLKLSLSIEPVETFAHLTQDFSFDFPSCVFFFYFFSFLPLMI